MTLSRELQRQIIEAVKKAHVEGRPLFKPITRRTLQLKVKPAYTEDEIFAQMKKLGGTIR